MTVRKIFGRIHLWLGLATGLVIFIVALTGAIYCFAPELQNATQRYRFVAPASTSLLPPSQIKAIAAKQINNNKIERIFYGEKNKAVYVLISGNNGFGYAVFINPYTGEVLKVKNLQKDFFTVVLKLHRTLLIPYGEEIIKWSTIIFLIMLLSGIVLWWPKNKAASKQRFSIKRGTSTKRLNYDLHQVLGFYASWIALFSALTGLMFSFDWFANKVYDATGAHHSIVQKKAPLSDTTAIWKSSYSLPIDLAWSKLQPDLKEKYVAVEFILPKDKQAALLVRAKPENGTLYKMDFHYFDQYTGKEIPGAYVWGKYSDAHTIADNIRRMNYDIHTGAILAWPGRIALFFAALIVASLPITGFFIWLRRNKKQKESKMKSIIKEVL